ncbi:MAG: cell division protein SepF [Armatimonadota bacterium]
MAGIFRRAAAALGFVDDDYYDDEYEDDMDYEDGEDEDWPGQVYRLPSAKEGFGNRAIVRARPHSMEDGSHIADKMKQRLPVAINLEELDETVARRIVDFLSGVTYALDGSMKKIGRAVFMCAPHDLPIEELETTQRPAETLFEETQEQRRPSFM